MGEVIQHWNSRPIGVAMRIVHEIGDREVQHCSFEQKKRAELSGPEMNAMLNIQQSDVPIRGSVNSEWEEKKKKKEGEVQEGTQRKGSRKGNPSISKYLV